MATRKTIGDVRFYLDRVNAQLERMNAPIRYRVTITNGYKRLDMYDSDFKVLKDTVGRGSTTSEIYYILLTLFETLYHLG